MPRLTLASDAFYLGAMKCPTPFKKHPILSSIVLCFAVILISSALWGRFKPLPNGTSIESEWFPVGEITFLHDLTYRKEGERQVEQEIFNHIFSLIEEAEEFVILDMFLFNDEYNREYTYPALAQSLTDKLIEKKTSDPSVKISVLTDPINTFYGSYPSSMIEQLEEEGISVTLTRLEALRHSNPIFSTFYAPFISHFGVEGNGWISNPFSPDSPKVTLRAILKTLNFRANHRKVIVSEKQAIVSSANPHDGSFYHCNIAFSIKGPIIGQIAHSESKVSEFSAGKILHEAVKPDSTETELTAVRWVTEEKVRKQWVEIIDEAKEGDKIDIAMFYISERKVIRAIKKAIKRGVGIRMVLDANKDAFGREKNGIPNRQVASELMHIADGNLQIHWYHTEGEQFHSKLMAATLSSQDRFFTIGGSANLTRRNICDYNLEADVCVRTPLQSHLHQEIVDYFDRICTNRDGTFTDSYETVADNSRVKKWIYRFQEFTGACTF